MLNAVVGEVEGFGGVDIVKGSDARDNYGGGKDDDDDDESMHRMIRGENGCNDVAVDGVG